MKVKFLIGSIAVAATVALAACGSPPIEVSAAGSTPGAATSSTPTPTPSPTPTVDPTALMPGKNHSNAAKAYAFDAKDVHEWLTRGPAGPNYPPTKLVFLTLDDGPNDRLTPRMLDALKAAEVPATFFYVTGPIGMEEADPEIVKRTIAEGHAIAIHTHNHNYRNLYPGGRGNAENIMADREKAITAIRKILGDDYNVSGYRYPGGHVSWKGLEAADQALADAGAYWIDWNAMNGDAEQSAPTSADGQLMMVKSSIARSEKPNVVVLLMHDHKYADMTVEAMPKIAEYFRSEGYEFGIIN